MNTIKQTTSEEIFPYIAYLPDDLGERPAVIFQLHGAGERGEGGEHLEKVLIHGFPKIATDQNLKNTILIMPQCPRNSFWAAKVESLKKFVDHIIEKFDANPKKVYLCGLSMGGFGTWYAAMAYPKTFAAIAPCCGGGMAWNVSVLDMPIWTFHGLEDTVVSPDNTIQMIEKLKSRPDFKYDLYEGVGHNSWERAFSEELLLWMLSQSR